MDAARAEADGVFGHAAAAVDVDSGATADHDDDVLDDQVTGIMPVLGDDHGHAALSVRYASLP